MPLRLADRHSTSPRAAIAPLRGRARSYRRPADSLAPDQSPPACSRLPSERRAVSWLSPRPSAVLQLPAARGSVPDLTSLIPLDLTVKRSSRLNCVEMNFFRW